MRNHSPVLQHIIEVEQVAVAGNDTFFQSKRMGYRFFYAPCFACSSVFLNRSNSPENVGKIMLDEVIGKQIAALLIVRIADVFSGG